MSSLTKIGQPVSGFMMKYRAMPRPVPHRGAIIPNITHTGMIAGPHPHTYGDAAEIVMFYFKTQLNSILVFSNLFLNYSRLQCQIHSTDTLH